MHLAWGVAAHNEVGPGSDQAWQPTHLVQDDLRSQVVRRAAQRVGPQGADDLGEPEVRQLQVAAGVKQQVLGLRQALQAGAALSVLVAATGLRRTALLIMLLM